MNAIARREHKEVAIELAGIWKSASKEEALTQVAAFKGKYHLRYPEAIRNARASLHLLCFSTGHASLHSQHQCD